jgi:hypothetical protein
MKPWILALVMTIGCSSAPIVTDEAIHVDTFDAGTDAESETDASTDVEDPCPNDFCFDGTWECDYCACVGEPCRSYNRNTGYLNVGTCGLNLRCSIGCDSPTCDELVNPPNRD